ncbi:TraR/DksA C4-type zinc finger protein [Salinicola aestuarinus]|uniref:TraR/DksA C4-type zinc finger protein n=1 Tax=Salinicola aestuarinus TaxID=1949082 RepID=UPI000DA22638|nr:TraR/DksA C4-type zinc finger protein [Salinicola aestuarinus]
MADIADNAGAAVEHHLATSLAQHALPPASDDPDCEDCGFEIPAARRAAAPWTRTCIECQSVREKRGRHVR